MFFVDFYDNLFIDQFRVGNMRHSQLVESHVRAILVSKKVTDEGEIIPYHPTELKVGVDIDGEVDTILFLWPATVIHKIDEESPFYHLNAQVWTKWSNVNFFVEVVRNIIGEILRRIPNLKSDINKYQNMI